MAPTRVLIVDDSVVVRKILSDVLTGESDLIVAGTAATGSIALQKIPQLNPDVVVLDVEMPGMDGLEVVKKIREQWPRLPVIMCSSLTERGGETTLRALANGASDCIAKPTALQASASSVIGDFRLELIAKVRMLGGMASLSPPPAREPKHPNVHLSPSRRPPVAAIGIGCSTGGPNALARLFDGFPRDLPVPIFIVQHMPPLFTKLLADRLASSSGLPVHEAVAGELVLPGHVYIAPGDHHMTVTRERLQMRIALNQDPPESSCRPAVDVLFRSLAQVYRDGVLGAVLTGMGHDGTRGSRAIVDAGGSVIVQDAESSVVPSMPDAVANAGLADAALPLDRLAQELVRRTRSGVATAPFSEHLRAGAGAS